MIGWYDNGAGERSSREGGDDRLVRQKSGWIYIKSPGPH